MYDFPGDVRYSTDHLWVRPGSDAGVLRVGLTDFAQQSLGDVVVLNVPREGDPVTAGSACGDVESTKSDSELIAPLTGIVRRHNAALDESPEAVNADPYGEGWLFDVEVDPSTLADQLGHLLDADHYQRLVTN